MKKLSILCIVFCLLTTTFAVVSGEYAHAAQSATETVAPLADKVNINTADLAILCTLPGVGEKTAAAILDYRKENGNFASIDDLARVKGIGEKKLDKIRPYLAKI
ncbi:MAG: ComEA family DNA-binding protein [Desulfopila sp.]